MSEIIAAFGSSASRSLVTLALRSPSLILSRENWTGPSFRSTQTKLSNRPK